MIQTYETLALAMTAALVPIGALLAAMHAKMLRLLRTEHNDVWIALGSPRLWFAKTVSETTETLGFLWRRDYRALENNRIARLCGFVRVLHIAFATAIVIAGVLFSVVAYHELGIAA